jgi:hypothetical protein
LTEREPVSFTAGFRFGLMVALAAHDIPSAAIGDRKVWELLGEVIAGRASLTRGRPLLASLAEDRECEQLLARIALGSVLPRPPEDPATGTRPSAN